MPVKRKAGGTRGGQSVAVLADEDDSRAVEQVLLSGGIEAIHVDMDGLIAGIGESMFGAAIVSDELIGTETLSRLNEALSNEKPAYCFPVLMLIGRAKLAKKSTLEQIERLRIIERPIHPHLLLTAVRNAFRFRALQHEAEAYSREVAAAYEHHRRVTESLELSLASQITDLEELSHRLVEEVNERRRAEEGMRESEELYRYTVELSQQMVWTSDPNGHLTSAGPRFFELTGLDPNQPLDGRVASIVHPDDLAQVRASWKRSVASGKPHIVEFRMRLRTGNYRMFSSRAAPRRDEEGRIIRWYGFTEDVHEQKLAAEAQQQAEERYRLAARATNDAVWDWDIATGHVAWSDAAATFLGNLPVDQSDIAWWEDSIHPDDRQRVLRSIDTTMASDKSRWSAAYRMRKADGEYAYVYDRGFFIRNEDGEVIRGVGAVVDLTERRRAEAELRRTQAELIHISRISAMGTMASTLAHELNQPLTAVTSYVRGCRRLLASFDDPNVQKVCEALEYAEAGALRAGQIVRRLRELVSRGTVTAGPEDLTKLIEDACVLAFVDEHLHGVSHRIEIDPDARWVEVDRIQIQQVLINLTRNAVQEMQSSERREVVISTRPGPDEMIEVSVADTGGGIPESVRDALFSPFNSTKTEGLGIGLSISRTIVEAHHGKIWAEDDNGEGAVFRFTLPRADVPASEVPEPAPVAKISKRRKQTV